MRFLGGTTGMTLAFGVGLLGGVALVAMLPGMPWITSVPDPTNNLDLGAQRSMAAAAWWMVILTTLAGVVGTASLWMIRENLLAAREVNKHAERSAKAAEQAVMVANRTTEISQLMGQAQVRCYLVVKRARLLIWSDGNVELQFAMLNSGQTPAKFVSVLTRIWFEYRKDDGSWDAQSHVFTEVKSRSDIPGQEERTGEMKMVGFVRPDTFQTASERAVRVLVDITLSSTDVFNIGTTETAYYGFEHNPAQPLYGDHTLYRIHR